MLGLLPLAGSAGAGLGLTKRLTDAAERSAPQAEIVDIDPTTQSAINQRASRANASDSQLIGEAESGLYQPALQGVSGESRIQGLGGDFSKIGVSEALKNRSQSRFDQGLAQIRSQTRRDIPLKRFDQLGKSLDTQSQVAAAHMNAITQIWERRKLQDRARNDVLSGLLGIGGSIVGKGMAGGYSGSASTPNGTSIAGQQIGPGQTMSASQNRGMYA